MYVFSFGLFFFHPQDAAEIPNWLTPESKQPSDLAVTFGWERTIMLETNFRRTT